MAIMTAFRFERSHTILLATGIVLFLLVSFSHLDLLPSSSSVSTSSSSHTFNGSNPMLQPHKPGQPLTLDQRMARSEASWQGYKKQQKVALTMLPPVYRGWMSENTKDHKMYVVWDFFNPAYTCPWDIERIGHLGDGGKWVCGLSKYIEFSEMAEQQQQPPPPPPRTKGLSKKADQDDGELDDGEHAANLVVYSFGVNDDSSFEEVMLAETNAEVVAVDYTVNSFGKELLPSHRNRSTFLKIGLGDADEPHHREAPFYTLSTIMRKRKHAYIDYLKIDIEGAEWASLGRFMDDCDDGIAGRTATVATTRKGKGKGKGTGKKKMGLKEAAVATAMERRSLDQLQQETTTREDAVFLGQIDDDDDDEEEEEEEEDGEIDPKMGGSRMPVGQLSMELHIDNELTFNFEDLIAFLDRLEGFGMRCVFFEVNYWGANSHPPRFVEMVWVNVNDPRNVLWHE